MKGLLLDQGLPRSAAALLRHAGFEAVHVGEVGMSTTADEVILEHARKHDLIVVTLDADFHALLALSGASGPSVVRLRVHALKAAEASALIARVVAGAAEELQVGSVASVTKKLIRIKRLPIKR